MRYLHEQFPGGITLVKNRGALQRAQLRPAGTLGSSSPDWGQAGPHVAQTTKVLERAVDYGVGRVEVQPLHLRSCVTWRQVLASLSKGPPGEEYAVPPRPHFPGLGAGQCRKKPPGVFIMASSLQHQLRVHKHTPPLGSWKVETQPLPERRGLGHYRGEFLGARQRGRSEG